MASFKIAPFLKRRPKKVAMVGLGPSANAFWLECAQWDGETPWEEVWVVNRAASAFHHDVCFNMHDLRALTQNAQRESFRILKADRPIVTVRAYPEYPCSVEYPLMKVLEFIKTDLLTSTPAYMVAYAMMIGVTDMWLYGMDFHYENVPQAEKGGQGMAYLLGMAAALKINFHIPNSSSLLGAADCVLVEHPAFGGQPRLMRPLYEYSLDGDGPQPLDPRVPEGAKVTVLNTPKGLLDVKNMPRSAMPRGADIGDRPVTSADGQPAALEMVP